ncbi:hypothetical protein G1H11_21470 [Phytoactinopolyspora alkaliphila]|uniref:Uncharacterized protein n=1 Tax=Phytoactinopolyspora alkaliphila TaxID=1783498 RepID=A0A6N9YSB6_9ACTN|nr:hypothetical protein [Phytoactinopolyspora alkaliphila]NED97872.1 hypothetical protein [Phytoactinopolyspora alkaliphila]
MYLEQWREWKYTLHRQSICYRLDIETDAFDPSHVIGGYARPFSGPQMWVSDLVARDDPWVELNWKDPVTFNEVALIFDDDVQEDLINLRAFRTPYEVLATLVRDYKIEAEIEGGWTLASERDHRRRHRVHQLRRTVTSNRLRIVMTSTNGAPRAHLIATRVYREPR